MFERNSSQFTFDFRNMRKKCRVKMSSQNFHITDDSPEQESTCPLTVESQAQADDSDGRACSRC